MTILKGLLTVAGCGFAFTICGGLIGWALGKLAPDFFRVMFPRDGEHAYDPARFGLGIGVANGVTWGLVTGLVVVLAVTFYQARRAKVS